MKKNIVIVATLISWAVSLANDIPPLPVDLGAFAELEMTVGYIQKENGEKFLIVETPEGTKLIKTKEIPKKNINSKERK